jgi:hypothetical protein
MIVSPRYGWHAAVLIVVIGKKNVYSDFAIPFSQ